MVEENEISVVAEADAEVTPQPATRKKQPAPSVGEVLAAKRRLGQLAAKMRSLEAQLVGINRALTNLTNEARELELVVKRGGG